MSDMMGGLTNWVTTIVTAGSLVFGGGILYADVQDIKRSVSESEGLAIQTKLLEVKLQNAEKAQEKTLEVLEKLSSNVAKLGRSVAKLEGRLG